MKLILFAVFWVVGSLPGLSQVVINEVAYTNKGLVKDKEGDYPDWFELFNNSGIPVNLGGYSITDDTSKLEYWKFPDLILQPGSFLLVFASDKDTVWGNEYHTSFRISNMKETIYLLGPEGLIVDQINPVCVPVDHSRARLPDGTANFAVVSPSPGNSNNFSEPVSVNYIRDTLIVNTASGFFENPLTIELTHQYEENEIRYTLDGEVPEEDAEIYSGPVLLKDLTPEKIRFADQAETIEEPGDLIFKANILRARVYSNGCPASNEIINTYFINKHIKYPVPVVSLITEEDNLFDDETGIYTHGKYRNFDQHGGAWERPVHVEIFDSTRNQVVDQDAGMRIHGRGSRRSPQKSLRLYADDDYGKDHFNFPYFSQKPGLSRFRVLLMRTTGGTLGPMFTDELCNFLVTEMDMDITATETAILFINGEYWGIYSLMERQNKYFIEDNYGIENADLDIVSYDRYVLAEEGDLNDYNNLIAYIQAADPSDPGFYDDMNSRIDLENMMNYYSAQFYFANADWPQSNLELWKFKNDTSRWRYFFFDSDASMEWLNDDHLREYNNDIGDFQRYDDFCTLIMRKMIRNERFRNEFMQRFRWHLENTFSPERVLNAVELFEKKYAPLVPEHIYRWHNPVSYLKWEKNVNRLRTFAIQRPIELAKQVSRNLGEAVSIRPNPNNGSFSLSFVNQPGTVRLKILSINGALIEQFEFRDNDSPEIPVHLSLPPGVYILHSETANSVFYSKLVIDHAQ